MEPRKDAKGATPGPWIVVYDTGTLTGPYATEEDARAAVVHAQRETGGNVSGDIYNPRAMLAENARLRDALETIADGSQMPGHVAYMSKARMAEVARVALAAAKGGAA